jgi:hypothetical protein
VEINVVQHLVLLLLAELLWLTDPRFAGFSSVSCRMFSPTVSSQFHTFRLQFPILSTRASVRRYTLRHRGKNFGFAYGEVEFSRTAETIVPQVARTTTVRNRQPVFSF